MNVFTLLQSGQLRGTAQETGIPAGAGVRAAGGPAASNRAPENPRLESAAHQFEASLMQELLKPMQEDPLFGDDTGGDGGVGSTGTIKSLATEAMARALSEHGGLGIARKVVEELSGGGTRHP